MKTRALFEISSPILLKHETRKSDELDAVIELEYKESFMGLLEQNGTCQKADMRVFQLEFFLYQKHFLTKFLRFQCFRRFRTCGLL